MSVWRKVCPWDCRGSDGEIDVVRAERALIPEVPAGAAVMRCGTCHGISLASMETMPSADGPHEVECRTPLGRFAGAVWVPASNYVSRIAVARPKGVRASGRNLKRR
jgi:hypothetical protein